MIHLGTDDGISREDVADFLLKKVALIAIALKNSK